MLDTQQVSNVTPKSVRLNRPFASPTWDDNANELQKSLASAKEALPEVAERAYKPSGQISALARIIMLLAIPFITLLVSVIIGLILLVYDYLGGWLNNFGVRGLAGILVDGMIVVVILTVGPWLYARLGGLLRSRNVRWPGILTIATSSIVAIIFFWPIWKDGATLAPTGILLLFIPLKWVIILIGGLIAPIISYWSTESFVREQKFCEISGVFLRPMQKLAFPFSWAEDVLELLSSENYEQIKNIPTASSEHRKAKHFAEVVLWWHEKAETAYLELTIFFRGKARTKTGQEKKEIKENWLVFSQRLGRSEAEQFLGQLKD